jgi:hypothetical protein
MRPKGILAPTWISRQVSSAPGPPFVLEVLSLLHTACPILAKVFSNDIPRLNVIYSGPTMSARAAKLIKMIIIHSIDWYMSSLKLWNDLSSILKLFQLTDHITTPELTLPSCFSPYIQRRIALGDQIILTLINIFVQI